MVDGTLLDALEAVARHVRRSDKPFGGIQLVLSGARPACSSACPLGMAAACTACNAMHGQITSFSGSIDGPGCRLHYISLNQQEEIMVHNSPFGRAQCGHAACEEQSCLDYAALDEPAVPRRQATSISSRRSPSATMQTRGGCSPSRPPAGPPAWAPPCASRASTGRRAHSFSASLPHSRSRPCTICQVRLLLCELHVVLFWSFLFAGPAAPLHGSRPGAGRALLGLPCQLCAVQTAQVACLMTELREG